ncbi:DUF6221 family protein [uncultured Jatrophihabitans sp.]|uniref:DUF6221 family protein n=1 Tax=uncultured Jatrophihabitans sp. TaxID=1610747 RepID=UPI0035CAC568
MVEPAAATGHPLPWARKDIVSASVTPSTLDELVGFLLARLDDDDAAIAGLHDGDERERRQAEARSHRAVVASAQQLLELRGQPNEKAVRDLAQSILRSLATPYAAHPAFREEWHAATR